MFLKFFRKKAENSCDDDTLDATREHGIDPAMHYCQSCNAEYRLSMPTCPVCGIPLISGSEKLEILARENERHAGRSMVLEAGAELVRIRQGPLAEMKYLQKVLAQGFIPGLISGDDNGGCGKGCCGPEMYLQIRKDDVGPALEILAKEFVRSTALDSHDLSNAAAVFDPTAAETVCPACGCTFSPTLGACPGCGLCFE